MVTWLVFLIHCILPERDAGDLYLCWNKVYLCWNEGAAVGRYLTVPLSWSLFRFVLKHHGQGIL